MATLSVLKFGTAEGAEEALQSLTEMQKQQLITIQDAAVVSWPTGQKKPKTRQAFSTVSAGALGGAFWGMLFGLLFFVPFLGLAIGAAMGALGGKMQDYGISDQLIKDIKSKVTEGTSALFVLSANAVGDRVVAEMKKWPQFEILSTNLSAEQEAQLRAEFGEG
jgi:uncharacterized membrane protein